MLKKISEYGHTTGRLEMSGNYVRESSGVPGYTFTPKIWFLALTTRSADGKSRFQYIQCPSLVIAISVGRLRQIPPGAAESGDHIDVTRGRLNQPTHNQTQCATDVNLPQPKAKTRYSD